MYAMPVFNFVFTVLWKIGNKSPIILKKYTMKNTIVADWTSPVANCMWLHGYNFFQIRIYTKDPTFRLIILWYIQTSFKNILYPCSTVIRLPPDYPDELDGNKNFLVMYVTYLFPQQLGSIMLAIIGFYPISDQRI